MIKKTIGIVVAVATIVVIIFAALRSEAYKSMVFTAGNDASTVELRESLTSLDMPPAVDSMRVEPAGQLPESPSVNVDSLSVK